MTTYVYELLDKNYNRIYIGQTSNLEKRLRNHQRNSTLLPTEFTMRAMATCESRKDAIEIEFAFHALGENGRCKISRGDIRRIRNAMSKKLSQAVVEKGDQEGSALFPLECNLQDIKAARRSALAEQAPLARNLDIHDCIPTPDTRTRRVARFHSEPSLTEGS